MPRFKSRKGLTIIELLIFAAVFTLIMIAFITILVSITRVQVRQTAAAEVNGQSQYLLQTVQYYVSHSSLIDLAADSPTSTLYLRMSDPSIDPTYIYASGTAAYIQQGTAAAQPLTSSKVNLSGLTFTKRSNPPAHDSVDIVFTLSYNAATVQEQFAQTLDTSIARVNAATFDSSVIPSSTATYDVGVTSQAWRSINNVLYFSGSNVGIGTTSPGQTLEVNGGVRLNTTAAQPTCSSSQRGTLWAVQSGAGVKDSVQVCVKNASDTYIWASIY